MALEEITIEHLKSNFSLEEAVIEINSMLPCGLSLDKNVSWEEIESKLEIVEIISRLCSKKNDQYFISNEIEVIYYLVELSGELQQEKLGIKRIYYKDKTKAKSWRDRLSTLIHPDRCHHAKATEAMEKLNELYDGMKKNAR